MVNSIIPAQKIYKRGRLQTLYIKSLMNNYSYERVICTNLCKIHASKRFAVDSFDTIRFPDTTRVLSISKGEFDYA